jgi:hypothetical protein
MHHPIVKGKTFQNAPSDPLTNARLKSNSKILCFSKRVAHLINFKGDNGRIFDDFVGAAGHVMTLERNRDQVSETISILDQ